jgi:hypothetical protein
VKIIGKVLLPAHNEAAGWAEICLFIYTTSTWYYIQFGEMGELRVDT